MIGLIHIVVVIFTERKDIKKGTIDESSFFILLIKNVIFGIIISDNRSVSIWKKENL